MLYAIILTFIAIYLLCAVLSSNVLIAIGETEAYWFVLFLLFGPLLIAYVLLAKKHKNKFNQIEKRKLIMYQAPIIFAYFIIVFMSMILV